MRKQLLLLTLLTISLFKINAQTDSLKILYENFKKLEYDYNKTIKIVSNNKTIVDDIQLNLSNCHKQYKTGITCSIVGLVLSTVGTILVFDTPEVGVPLIIGGSGLSITGVVITINSHKYIGRAGSSSISMD